MFDVLKRRHVVTHPEGKTANRRRYWVATCACGWHGRPESNEYAAREAGEAHTRAALGRSRGEQ